MIGTKHPNVFVYIFVNDGLKFIMLLHFAILSYL